MKALRVALTLAVGAGSVLALVRYVATPYTCNLRLQEATQRLNVAMATQTDNLRASRLARQSVQEMQHCVRARPGDVPAQMVLAAHYRVLERNEEAAAAYETALRYGRRPELYFNLGQTQLAMGYSDRALENLTLACIYNPSYINEIGEHQPAVKRAVDEYQLRLLQAR